MWSGFLSHSPVCWPVPLKAGGGRRPAAGVNVSLRGGGAAARRSPPQTPACEPWTCTAASTAAAPLYLRLEKHTIRTDFKTEKPVCGSGDSLSRNSMCRSPLLMETALKPCVGCVSCSRLPVAKQCSRLVLPAPSRPRTRTWVPADSAGLRDCGTHQIRAGSIKPFYKPGVSNCLVV